MRMVRRPSAGALGIKISSGSLSMARICGPLDVFYVGWFGRDEDLC